jgi:hypothetical protein
LLSDGTPNPITTLRETDDDNISLDCEDREDDLEGGKRHQSEEDSDLDVEADEDEVDDPDAVTADSDEELDNDILRKEGYGAL